MFDFSPYQPSDEAAVLEVWMQAFDALAAYWPDFLRRIGAENVRVLRSGGVPIGMLGVYRMGQWFGGECVPCGGLAAVAIAPEHRHRGGAKLMLTRTLAELRAAGVPLAALYPSSQAVYRAVGFEQGGSRCHYELPLRHVGVSERGITARRISMSDTGPLAEVYRRRVELENGVLDRTAGLWERLLVNPSGHRQYGYVVEEQGELTGSLIYYLDDAGQSEPTKIFIRDWCALTPGAARRIWTLIGDHGSVVEAVNWFGPVNDPMLAHVAEFKLSKMRAQRWMLRVLDVAAALTTRGYPGVSGELHLDVIDPLIAENTGRFVLSVRDGAATVAPGGRGELKCDVRGLAPLYTGIFRPDVLARTGWITGSAEALAAAAKLFAGPEPWMPEYF